MTYRIALNLALVAPGALSFGITECTGKLCRTDADIGQAVSLWNNTGGAGGLGETNYGKIQDWDTSKVTSMNELFYGQDTFNDDISKWDVSAVTDMYHMFYQANEFNQDLSEWDVSAAATMSHMFKEAWDFNQDIREWDVSSCPP